MSKPIATDQPPAAGPAREPEPPMGAVRAWILQHDESWLFTISYVGLAVVLSIWISLFWLVAVVGVHFVLEWIRQSHFAERSRDVLRRVLWELKLDGALILFAFALTAYLEVILGMAGLAGASRMGLQAGARFAGWSRVLRGVLLSLDDLAHLGRLISPNTSAETESADHRQGRWSVGDHLAIWFGLACLLLLLAAPLLTPHTAGSLCAALLAELHPFPGS